MAGTQTARVYDLEERTYLFARQVRTLLKRLPRTIAGDEDCRQLARSSGSVGANYIEANEALGKKDFQMHVRIARKEAKETRYWLRLLDTGTDESLEHERASLLQESTELLKILSTILLRSQTPKEP